MPLIDIIVGARPNFIKVSPIIKAIQGQETKSKRLDYRLVHTGQHYDKKMSGDFFEQLEIPKPDINLGVGSGTQAEQAAAIMVRYEKALTDDRPDACLVVGDVTSTMACAITAQKQCVPVGHVEAGIRSNDWSMPEEINRMATDSITNWFFTTSQHANENLRKMGIEDSRIFFVGNTMIDTLLANMDRLCKPKFWDIQKLVEREYFILTLHRPANVDEQAKLVEIIQSIIESRQDKQVIFPVHPRTKKNLNDALKRFGGLFITEPLSYLEFNFLVKNAFAVITDSGGISEETTVMGVPCLTLRDTTERPETVSLGTNELIGTQPSAIAAAIERLRRGQWKKGEIPELWDGKSGERIVRHIQELCI